MRERVKPEIIAAVEEYARMRILSPSDKEILEEFPMLSRSSLYRILGAAKKKLESKRLERKSQMGL